MSPQSIFIAPTVQEDKAIAEVIGSDPGPLEWARGRAAGAELIIGEMRDDTNMNSMVKIFSSAVFGVVIGAAVAAPASAGGLKDEEPVPPASGLEISYNVSGTTDYVFRGFSQTVEDPALQGGADLTYGMFYAGVWGSRVDFGDDSAHVEVDLYGGIKKEFRGIEFDLGFIYYAYPNADDPADGEFDYWEIKAGVSGNVWDDLNLGAVVYYSPEFFGETGEVWTFEGKLSKTLPAILGHTLTLSGTVGYVEYEDDLLGDDYTYWNVGLSKTVMDHFTFDVRYWDTDVSGGCGGICDERVVGTFTVSY